MNDGGHARLAFRGKLRNDEGEIPGALEERDLALFGNGPVFLVGGLGGVARAVYDVIVVRPVPTLLTHAGQAAARPHATVPARYYEEPTERLRALGPDWLAARNGLDSAENERLSDTQSAIEIVDLRRDGPRAPSTAAKAPRRALTANTRRTRRALTANTRRARRTRRALTAAAAPAAP